MGIDMIIFSIFLFLFPSDSFFTISAWVENKNYLFFNQISRFVLFKKKKFVLTPSTRAG